MRRARSAFAWSIVVVATVFPLSIPSLAGEISWDAGIRYPRMLNWSEAHQLADIISANHLNNRLLAVYQFSLGPAIAVFTPVTVQRGHWVEVQPVHDPANNVPAGDKTYIVPLAPEDPMLDALSNEGLIKVYGGTGDTAVLLLDKRARPDVARALFVRTVSRDAEWLALHSVNNGTPAPGQMFSLVTAQGRAAHRRQLDVQRFFAGRMEMATLIYAYSLEPTRPRLAKRLRRAAMDFGTIASYLSDTDPLGRISVRQQARFRRNMAALGVDIAEQGNRPFTGGKVSAALDRLFRGYLGSAA